MGDLLESTASLVDIASVSGNEAAIADRVENQLRSIDTLEVSRIENNVIARSYFGRTTRLLLGGHLDTVPPAGNERARIEADRCYGCGAGDMKGGLAVLLELARCTTESELDITFVFYACEEVARADSGLLVIDANRPELLTCDAAILLEPTNASVEAGCQGVIRARIDVVGARAHAARPWMGVNAIHRAGAVVVHATAFEERQPVIDGCRFHESMQVVRIAGGVASNVVPDLTQLEVTMRFVPDLDVDSAISVVESHFAPVLDVSRGDRIEIIDAARAASPSLSNPLLRALSEKSGNETHAKLGWTDVVFFSERDTPATNFGPGDPTLAHSTGEFVSRADLATTYDTLHSLICPPSH